MKSIQDVCRDYRLHFEQEVVSGQIRCIILTRDERTSVDADAPNWDDAFAAAVAKL